MAETYSLAVAPSCVAPANGQGTLTVNAGYQFVGGMASDEVASTLYLLAGTYELAQQVAERNATIVFDYLTDAFYGVEWRETDSQRVLARGGATIGCGGTGGGSPLQLDSASATNETAAGSDGTATIQARGGVEPYIALLVDLSSSQPAASAMPATFTALPAATYTLRTTDSSTPPQAVEAEVRVGPYLPPHAGCQDEYATNYDPLATSASSCDYAPAWRSAWGPGGVLVRVPAVSGQVQAWVTARLRIGFRPGHPLAALRPLGDAVKLRATIGPDGYATFRLGPYLRAVLGSDDGAGGKRLDINSETADDLFCGYELRRAVSAELLDHGYVVNAAVPDAELVDGRVLSSFARVPVWPGYEWTRQQLSSSSAGRFGALVEASPASVHLPCPPHPLPVAWLNPWGAWDYWVFQGRPQLGDDVGEGQSYTEAGTGQRRYSEPGAAYQTFKATSGVFRGDDLLAGLRTLWRSPQAWVQLEAGGEWLPILVERGQRDVGRLGVARQEVAISFSLASPEFSQGQ